MLTEDAKPLQGCEAVHDRYRAQGQEAWRDGGLLGCDDDAGCEVALLADEPEQLIGEGGRCDGGRYELDDEVSRT